MELRLDALTYPEVKQRIAAGHDLAVLPLGAMEQHGPHGPLGTDAYIAYVIAQGVAEKTGAFLLPPQWFGVSRHHMSFAGSLTIKPAVLAELVEDVLESLIHHGIKKILVLNGHGGNTASISSAFSEVRGRHPEVFMAQSAVWLALNEEYDGLPAELKQENFRTMVGHGGLLETSIVMAVEEDSVVMERAQAISVAKYVLGTDPAMSVAMQMQELSPIGSNGDPRGSSAKTGRFFVERSVAALVRKFHEAYAAFKPGN